MDRDDLKKQQLKSSQNKRDLNDITAALFSVSFSQLQAAKKQHRKRGSYDVIKVLCISWQLYQIQNQYENQILFGGQII